MNYYVTHLYSLIPFRTPLLLSSPVCFSSSVDSVSVSLFPGLSSCSHYIMCSIPSSFLSSISGGIPGRGGRRWRSTYRGSSDTRQTCLSVRPLVRLSVCPSVCGCCKTPWDEGRGDGETVAVNRFRFVPLIHFCAASCIPIFGRRWHSSSSFSIAHHLHLRSSSS